MVDCGGSGLELGLNSVYWSGLFLFVVLTTRLHSGKKGVVTDLDSVNV